MMLAAAATVRIHRRDDIGTHGSDHPDEVAEDGFTPPQRERLVTAERVAEIDRAGEVLFGTVEAMRCQQLLRA